VPLFVDWVTFDCHDPAGLGRFWAEALGYDVVDEADDEVLIAPRDGSKRRLLFLRVAEVKSAKNRLHLDLRAEDQLVEVERLERLGATRVDIGQGDDVSWVVMADPEGNEFCLLRTMTDEERTSVPWGD